MGTVVEKQVRPIVGSNSGRCEICLGSLPVTQIVWEHDDGSSSIFDVCRSCADMELAGEDLE
jgi:hypothetical protein